MNRLSTRILLAMLVVTVVSLTVVPVAQLVAERVTFGRLPVDFRDQLTQRAEPSPFTDPFTIRRPRSAVEAEQASPQLPSTGPGSASEQRAGAEMLGLREENLQLFNLFADLRAAQRQAFLGGLAFALLLSAALALRLSRSIARPLEAVSKAASRLAAGELATRVALRGSWQPGETLALAGGFNAMAASLERLEGERKAMLADIAHELRTPLAAMVIRIEALEDGLVTFDAAEIDLLKSHTSLLTRLIDDLRLLSLADAGRLTLDLSEVDLGAWLRQATWAYEDTARKQGARLDVRLPDEPLRVQIDTQRLRQVLQNLIDNAAKVSPESGTIEVILEVAGDEALVRVRDHGPGIPQEELDTIFKRFVHGRRRDTRGPAGSGLGLAIVRTLVALHGGSVSAHNHADGAELQVRLPLIEPGSGSRLQAPQHT